MDSASPPWLVVGLGNPGVRYALTRHNIGWLVLDECAGSEEFRAEPRFEGLLARVESGWLLKPTTFMNLSGVSVRAVADYFKIPRENVLVVLDDAALPFGRLRIRGSGSAGSHNGLASVLAHFSREAVPRLRVGVGEPVPPMALHDHVLGRFSAEEQEQLPEIIARAAQAIGVLTKNGLAAAMNEFNKGGS